MTRIRLVRALGYREVGSTGILLDGHDAGGLCAVYFDDGPDPRKRHLLPDEYEVINE